jgi:hypothetical protein
LQNDGIEALEIAPGPHDGRVVRRHVIQQFGFNASQQAHIFSQYIPAPA